MADKRHVDLLQQGFMKPKRKREATHPMWCCNNGHTHPSRGERDACDASPNPLPPGILTGWARR